LTSVTELGPGLYCIDLEFGGLPGVIASYLLEGNGEYTLIETGPTTTINALLSGLQHLNIDPRSIRNLLVTHIHLDHAGAAGVLIDRFPEMQLYVHEVGAPHLIDPSKLLASASRIYGDRMGPLWGDVLPVPERNVHVLTDGDRVTVGNHELQAVYTPGHASHHVVYRDETTKDVYAGDVAGVRLQNFDTIRPPTPPPDIDLGAWKDSLHRIAAMEPRRLLLTHYGPHENVEQHLQETASRLDAWSDVVRKDFDAGTERDEVVRHLQAFARMDVANSDDRSASERYELATPTYMSADGLLRYFRKQQK
jgi:glyoxylase-like metal-dependent hydrolase (beta-lactamase superfamily II)